VADVAVIFDMDGVLIDSYAAHFESWRQLYRELGMEYSEEAFAADFGRTSGDILRRTVAGELTDERIRQLDNRKESLYRDMIRRDFPAMDGASDLLDALAADGFRLGVGSSGPPENIALSLEMIPGGERMSAVVTRADVTRGKPDPQVFQIAAARLGVPPARCAVVEDAAHGIEAANRAGMKSIALTGTMSRDAFDDANLVVESLRELSPSRIRELLGA
jgi:beta-phosphoglucomutase